LDHIVSLAEGEGLGIVIDSQASDLIGEGKAIRKGKTEEQKPRKEDIVEE
jgi:LETM1 and EF-hand domain-containing protein 1, mitochondrial